MASSPSHLHPHILSDRQHQTSLLTAQHCTGHVHLILGANPLAAARASSSLAAGAKPILISPLPSSSPSPDHKQQEQEQLPQLHYSLTTLIAAGTLIHLPRAFTPSDLFTLGREDVNRVVDAVFITSPLVSLSSPSAAGADVKTEQPAALDAAAVASLCKQNRIPVNVVDAPELCSFSLLSVHTDGPLQIGVTTNGRGCKLAGRVRREVAASLPPGLGAAVERLGGLRKRLLLMQQQQQQQERGSKYGGTIDNMKMGGEEGLEDDSVDQPAGLNRLVLEGDAEAAKTRRMRWLAQVCEYWPLRKLAEVSDEDVEGILSAYQPGSGAGTTTGESLPPHLKLGSSSGRIPTGRVILAGSGPGHPDLLTRATYKAIQTADLILADKLVPAGVLDLIPRRTPVSIARKFPGNADRAQEELLEQALDGVRAGKTVLRLKQGDPFIYGRGGEEVAFFRQNGLGDRVTVLPGITSSLSAPLFAGIPPTQRDVADQVLVCTGTGKKGKAPQPPEFVESRTVVFLMALHRIDGLVAELTRYTEEEQQQKQQQQQQQQQQQKQQQEAERTSEAQGESEGREGKRRRALWPLNTPCAVIERASCPDQRVIRTTLRFVAEAIEQEGSRPPGLLVVGRACEALYTPEKGRSWVVEDGFKGLELDSEGGFTAGGPGIAGIA
ncbi:tetrapyrrole methylase [Corynascus novoguineensis]|uniref:precorrin-2 dehydrogenase n=1 Tax=Corynascus novoguineensis TaxID=1126955 RepID=A0AAN7CRI7_9PEZI|nr:tetrapyrrole methylase [Corynascus novoguineensis]